MVRPRKVYMFVFQNLNSLNPLLSISQISTKSINSICRLEVIDLFPKFVDSARLCNVVNSMLLALFLENFKRFLEKVSLSFSKMQ